MTDQVITASLVKLLRKLSGQENCYTIPKLYVQLTECHVRALILNQLVFYSDKSTRHEEGWFDKSYQEWENETYVKERTLRNIFKEFKEKNWCDSRVELVNGVTTLCCKPNLENILSDIKEILDNEPSGKFCRTPRKNFPNPPANFAVPTNTYNNPDKNTDMCGENSTQPINFDDYKKQECQSLEQANELSKQEKMEREAVEDPENKKLFEHRFKNRSVSYEDMFKACKEHYTQKNQWVGSQRFKQWITREKPENYPQLDSRAAINQAKKANAMPSDDVDLLNEYKHWLRTHAQHGTVPLENWIRNPEKRARALELHQKEMETKNGLAAS